MAAPFEATEEAAMRLNTVAEIAKEEGVPFLNYVKEWDSLGMDANTDFYDGGHFNNQGIVKFSRIVGQYLSQNYSLRDCRKLKDLYGMLRRQLLIKQSRVYLKQSILW